MALTLRDFNTGAEAIKEAAKGNGGNAGGFAPQVKWEVGEEKYVQFLLSIEETPQVSIHEWLDCGTKENGKTDWGFFLSRTDPVLGEDSDPITEKGSTPKKRILSAAVEVEPIMGDNGRGRMRPKGFEVVTSTYDRKTDDGTEEVTQPVVGYVSQASANFFQILVASDEGGEYEGTVYKIKRTDDKTYAFTPYLDMDVDYTALIENIEGVSYLARNEEVWGDLEPALANAENDEERAHLIGVALLERRLNELADYDEYKRKTDNIEKFESRFGNDNKGSNKKERPARQSQRTAKESSGAAKGKADPEASREKFDAIKKLASQKSAPKSGPK